MASADLRNTVGNQCGFTKKRDGLPVVLFWGGVDGTLKVEAHGIAVGNTTGSLWCSYRQCGLENCINGVVRECAE